MKSVVTALFSLAVLAPAAHAQETGSDTARFDHVGVRRDSIVPDARDRAAAATLSELLAARVPGLQVRPGSGAVGSGSRLRLRGAPGIVATGDPLVVVNGIRVIRDPNSAILGGEPYPSRVDDFVPDDVERVEVFSGPAAVARYGSEGANGVVEVWTRRGSAGAPRVHAFAEAGVASDVADYPAAYGRLGTIRSGTVAISTCTLSREAIGYCTPFGGAVDAGLDRDALFRTGGRRRAGASVEGGAGELTYQLGANGERDLGVMRRDSRERVDAHGSFTLRAGRAFQLTGSAMHVRNELELPLGGTTFLNPLFNAFVMHPFGNVEGFASSYPLVDTLGTTQEVRRTLAGASARWSPLGWLVVGGTFGIDKMASDETGHPYTPPSGAADQSSGEGDEVRRNAELFAEAEYGAGSLRFATMLGAERWSSRTVQREELRSEGSSASRVLKVRGRTDGLFARQRVAWRDRVTASLTVRREEPLASSEHLYSGAVGAEWDLGGESFFARPGWMDSFRLRAGYSRAETGPGFIRGDFVSCSTPAQCRYLGIDPIKPQRQSELEGGFDAGLLADRAGVSLTVYDRATADAMGFLGRTFSSYSNLLGNVGRVTNRGAEARVRLSAPREAPLFWEVAAIGALNRNRLAESEFAPQWDGYQSFREGKPVGSFYGRRITGYRDLDGNGAITAATCGTSTPTRCEVELSGESEYLGAPDPTRMLALQGRLRVRAVELAALLDHQGGNQKRNGTAEILCGSLWVERCRGAYDASAPRSEQARAAILGEGLQVIQVEDASFTRLREASLSVTIPGRWARTVGGRGARLTLAGRNLLTWTPFSGLDPETNAGGQSAYRFEEAFTLPLPRTLTTRIDVSF